jgi:hypothetical protein
MAASMTEPSGDEVLEALSVLIDVLELSRRRIEAVKGGAEQLRRGRSHGATYAELLTGADSRGLIDGLRELLDDLVGAASGLRRAEASALRGEGLSMNEVGAVLRVSRQRASAIVKNLVDQVPEVVSDD